MTPDPLHPPRYFEDLDWSYTWMDWGRSLTTNELIDRINFYEHIYENWNEIYQIKTNDWVLVDVSCVLRLLKYILNHPIIKEESKE